MSYSIYHERQRGALCGLHCLNNLLQGPCFTAQGLANIAEKFNQREKILMAEYGFDTQDYEAYLMEGNSNNSGEGMFSVQVLESALADWNVTITNIKHPDMKKYRWNPRRASGFIINLQEHWYAIRPINGDWWDLNSFLAAPRMLDGNFIESLYNHDQCTILVVTGVLPPQPDPRDMKPSSCGHLWTLEEAMREHENRSGHRRPADTRNHQESTQHPLRDLPKPEGYPQASGSTQAAAAGDAQPTRHQNHAGRQQITFLPPRTEAATRYLKLLASVDD